MLFYIIIALIAVGIFILALKKPFVALLIFLFLLPLNAFIITYAKHLFDLDPTQRLILTLWKEWLVFCLLIWAVYKVTQLHNYKVTKLYWFDYLIFGLFILALLTIIWGIKDIKTIAFGLRYDFEFFAVYFIGRVMRPNPKELTTALKVVLASSLIVVIFGILQATVLPWDFLNKFGYTYALEWTPGNALQSSQIVGSTRELSRIISTLSGPNQLGSYLTLIGVLLLSIILFARKNLFKIGAGIYFLIILLPLYRTYSRSAWLGLVCALIVLLTYLIVRIFSPKRPLPKSNFLPAMITIVAVVSISIAGFAYLNSANPILLQEMARRGFSTSNHLEALSKGVELIKDHPAGLGIGFAGPASQWGLGLENSVITESFFLQIGVEMGVLGIIAFVIIIISLIIKLFREINRKEEVVSKIILLGSALGLIALSVNALFLHSFADTATSLTLFALIGMSLSRTMNKMPL
ncbi:MAG: O-antigen ligase WaaL [Candidatus Berkelbacteria bacterium Licking1014_96]|uniref:O-antigen ligase WaaL n=1 Tax=Candidatus Berkelbacteria bacterium Licking1014_96 TaxID=2017149 RepID=A0A554LGW0_9BACT|nr:MAG: O-antigen ligase WaaL [Candidatus Berkelbacteria bacterium Licking1014_96]